MNKEFFKNIVKERKLRLSHPRLLVYQELSKADRPLSPQELYQSLLKKRRKIGLTSIYRSLDLFESLGILFKTMHGPDAGYRLCESEDHHHHVICKTCGHVVELDFCDLADWSRKVTESTGFEVTEHELNFYGYCKGCNPLEKRQRTGG